MSPVLDAGAGPVERNPVSVVQVVHAGMLLAVAFGWAAIDDARVAAVLTFVGLLVSLGGQLWARRQVTPLIDPRDDDGTALVRQDTGTPPGEPTPPDLGPFAAGQPDYPPRTPRNLG